jgi:hypothetical protein
MDDAELAGLIRQAVAKRRGYADFFQWPDQSIEERGVAEEFLSQVTNLLGGPFSNLRARGQGQDPPDCEALNARGQRLGIEVTELVDRKAIARSRRRGGSVWAEWDRAKLVTALADRLRAKDVPGNVKGGPYDRYVLLTFTDEPELSLDRVAELLTGQSFARPTLITDGYLLLSYDPKLKKYPVHQLSWQVGA